LVPFLLLGSLDDALAQDLELDWGGRVQTDIRFRIEPKSVGSFYNKIELPVGVERNQNVLGLKLNASYGRFKGVADVDLVLTGYPKKPEGLGSLTQWEGINPFRLEANSLYIEANNLFVDGLDLRLGQQVVSWGVGDQFNPTNNLNSDDLRDKLLFGKQQANVMAKLDYWLNEDWSFSGVLVPIFRPALLPDSAELGLASLDRVPFTDDTLRPRIQSELAASSEVLGHPTVVGSITPVLPDSSFDNMQVAYRIAGTIAEHDLSLSYYNGRTDFPQPFEEHTVSKSEPQCNPDDAKDCIEGKLVTAVKLHYPRMHVYGLNAAGEIPLSWISESLSGIGYRVEGALTVPQRATMKITNDMLALAIPQPAGEYDYDNDGIPGGPQPAVVDATPFLKWVVGLDYTFGEHVYVNAQWVHGMMDEYGAGDFIHKGWAVRQGGASEGANLLSCALQRDGTQCAREVLRPRLGDYVVLGMDLKFMDTALLIRTFFIVDVTGFVVEEWDDEAGKRVQTKLSPFSKEGYSVVIFPEVGYNFGNGLELAAGVLLQLGEDYTKFGDPAAGGSLAWTRGRFSF
jgi:hypothetical protein